MQLNALLGLLVQCLLAATNQETRCEQRSWVSIIFSDGWRKIMNDESRYVWHVRRAPNTSAIYYLSASIGTALGIPLIYIAIYLIANYFDNVFNVFAWAFFIFTLANILIYRQYKKNPGKVYRHPTIGHAIHDGQPTAKLYVYGTYFCLLLVLISAADSPMRANFISDNGFTRYQWFLFIVDNVVAAIIFDFAEIFGLGLSSIEPINRSGETLIFCFRTLMTISFFDFVLSVSRTWKTDRLMLANLNGLRRDMKTKEVAAHTLLVAPVDVGEYSPLYSSQVENIIQGRPGYSA